MSGKALAVKLTHFSPHPNADRLKMTTVNGYQIIVGVDTPVGTEGLFFSTETPLVIDSWFLTEHNLYRDVDKATGKNNGGMFERNGRVKSVKIRGVRSDGFFIEFPLGKHGIKIGDAVDTLDGKPLCHKYINELTLRAMRNSTRSGPQSKANLPEHFDTENLRTMIDKIPVGATIVITEKYHGTSARTGLVESGAKWYHRWLGRKVYNYVTGSRRVIVHDEGTKEIRLNDYHGDSSYRLHWHNRIKETGLHKGEIIFYEIVGYTPGGAPLMGKHVDGDQEIVYHYGNDVGLNSIHVYRIAYQHENIMLDLSYDDMRKRCVELGLTPVPELARLVYDGDVKSLVKLCLELGEKPSTDGLHQREGVVLDVSHHLYRMRRFVKQKSLRFMELENIYVDKGFLDIEDTK